MKATVGVTLVIALLWVGCSKQDGKKDIPSSINTYDTLDLGIRFTHYQSGIAYTTDSVLTEFELTNNSKYTLKKGDIFRTASKIGGVTFALDLIGAGPTKIELPNDIAPGEKFVYNPGYLLRQSLLDYFKTDTVDLCIMAYGINDSIFLPNFYRDPTPGNNTTCVRCFSNGIKAE
jgi:hypothetical protein